MLYSDYLSIALGKTKYVMDNIPCISDSLCMKYLS